MKMENESILLLFLLVFSVALFGCTGSSGGETGVAGINEFPESSVGDAIDLEVGAGPPLPPADEADEEESYLTVRVSGGETYTFGDADAYATTMVEEPAVKLSAEEGLDFFFIEFTELKEDVVGTYSAASEKWYVLPASMGINGTTYDFEGKNGTSFTLIVDKFEDVGGYVEGNFHGGMTERGGSGKVDVEGEFRIARSAGWGGWE
jgi:hypothetical protein